MDSIASWVILLALMVYGLWKLVEAIGLEEIRRHELNEREWANVSDT